MKELKLLAVRHGECVLYPVDTPVGRGKKLKTFVVGHSETGHHHVLESKTDFELFELTHNEVQETLIRLFKPATLVHKKTVNRHKDLVIPAGTYKIIHKVEYNPFTKIIEKVWD